jgi:sulfoxide reductase heme-binding subunit YedZ
MIKRMGARSWKRLHRLAYVAATLAVLHYIWLAKKVLLAPWIYAAILALLLGIRLWDAARPRRARMWLTHTPDI